MKAKLLKPQLLIAVAFSAFFGTVALFGLDVVGRSKPHAAHEVAYPVITEASDVRSFVGRTVTLRGQYNGLKGGPSVLGVRVGQRPELYDTAVDVTGRLEWYADADHYPKSIPDSSDLDPVFPQGPFGGVYLVLVYDNDRRVLPTPVLLR